MGTSLSALLACASVALGAAKPPAANPQFVVLKPGFGAEAHNDDLVRIRFSARRIDGKEVANSLRRGLDYSFVLGETGVDPIIEAVQPGMRVGCVWRVWLDAETSVDVTLIGVAAKDSG